MTAVQQYHIADGWKWDEQLDQAAHRYNVTLEGWALGDRANLCRSPGSPRLGLHIT